MWALYMCFNKYGLNLYQYYLTGQKPIMEFIAEDIQSYKKISLGLTLLFLVVSVLLKITLNIAFDHNNVPKAQ